MAKKQAAAQTAIEGLTAGGMVHYVLDEDKHRPAVVISVADAVKGIVNLAVFMDGENDGYAAGAMGRAVDVRYSEDDKHVGSWHFIEGA